MSQLAELYNTKYLLARSRGWSGWGSKHRAEGAHVLIDRIMRHPLTPQSGRCLELGCGEGRLSRKLAGLGFSVTGIDISGVAIDWAKEKQQLSANIIVFQKVDLTIPGLSLNGPYDFILDGHCLHCIPAGSRPAFLDNVKRSLAENGTFIVSSRCTKDCDDTVIDSGLEYRHFHQPDSLLKELRAAGFGILDVTEYDRGTQVHLDIMLSG